MHMCMVISLSDRPVNELAEAAGYFVEGLSFDTCTHAAVRTSVTVAHAWEG